MPYFALAIIFSILCALGLAGAFLPFLPGVPYMLAVAVIFGFIDKFQHLTSPNIYLLVFLTILSLAIDHFSGVLGAKYGGASRQSLILGFIGFIIGTLVLPPYGGIIGLFFAVLVVELLATKDHIKAVKAAGGSLFGTLTGMVANFILSLAFLTIFIIFIAK